MKKPAFCIIGAKKSDNTKDLFWAAKKGGYECAKINISNMLFENEGRDEKFIISCDGKNLLDFDIFIFRSYSKNILEARILIDHLAQNKKTILDAVLAKKYVTGKMHEASIFANAKISYLRTIQALEESVWEKNIEKLKFPIIVKPIAGSQGKDVQKINTKEEAINFFQENPKGFIAQEYAPIDGDIRVLVVGGKVLGAIKRYVVDGDVRSNASIGARVEKISLTKELEKISLDAVSAIGLDIAGVDIIVNDGKYYVLEVNSAPQWQAFKKATKINPAEYIINYAMDKHLQS